MAWVAVDIDDYEYIFSSQPTRDKDGFLEYDYECVQLPYGSIEKLIGYELDYLDEPVELKAAYSATFTTNPKKTINHPYTSERDILSYIPLA